MLSEIMINLGYSQKDIDRIRNTDPIDGCGDNYLCLAVTTTFKLFNDFGYTAKQIIKMTTERPQIFAYDIISDKLQYLLKLLGDKKIVIKVTLDFPTLFSYDTKTLDGKIADLVKLGYKKDVIIKNIKNYPELLGLSIEDNIKQMINEFKKNRFSDAEILKITSRNPSVFGRDKKIIKDTLDKYEGLGYSRKDVISMLKKHPQIFNYDPERINERISFLVSSGIANSDVLSVFRMNPALIGDAKETFENKKIFYDSIGLHDIFVKAPKDLIQGIAKSYARFMYFQTIGFNIHKDKKSYKELFIGEKRFKSKYHVKSSELIKMYDVKEYMVECKKRKLSNKKFQ